MFEMLIRLLTVVLLAVIAGKVAAKFKMPAVLGFLIAGMLLGPYAVNLLTQDILDNSMYHTLIELMECGMGLMLGRIQTFKINLHYAVLVSIILRLKVYPDNRTLIAPLCPHSTIKKPALKRRPVYLQKRVYQIYAHV